MTEAIIWYDARAELPEDGVPVRIEYMGADGNLVLSTGVYHADTGTVIDTVGNVYVPVESVVEWSYDATKAAKQLRYK